MRLEQLERNRAVSLKSTSLDVINLPVCRETVLFIELTKFIWYLYFNDQNNSTVFIALIQVATVL